MIPEEKIYLVLFITLAPAKLVANKVNVSATVVKDLFPMAYSLISIIFLPARIPIIADIIKKAYTIK